MTSYLYFLSTTTSGEFTTLGITPVPLPITTTIILPPSTIVTSLTTVATTTVEVTAQETTQSASQSNSKFSSTFSTTTVVFSSSSAAASATSVSSVSSSAIGASASTSVRADPTSPLTPSIPTTPITPSSSTTKTTASLNTGAKVGIGTSTSITGVLILGILLVLLFRKSKLIRRLRLPKAQEDQSLPLTERAYAVPGRHAVESLSGTTNAGDEAAEMGEMVAGQMGDSSQRGLHSISAPNVPAPSPQGSEPTSLGPIVSRLGVRQGWRKGVHELGG